jgi:hypothetical protein
MLKAMKMKRNDFAKSERNCNASRRLRRKPWRSH